MAGPDHSLVPEAQPHEAPVRPRWILFPRPSGRLSCLPRTDTCPVRATRVYAITPTAAGANSLPVVAGSIYVVTIGQDAGTGARDSAFRDIGRNEPGARGG